MRSVHLPAFAFPLLFMGLSTPAAGQDPGTPADTVEDQSVVLEPALEPGVPIRVTLIGADRSSYGRFVDVDPDVLRLRRDDGSNMILSLPVEEIEEIGQEVQPPDRDQAALRGGLYGAGIALVGGALLQAMPSQTPNMAMAGGMVLAIPLGAVGAMLGNMAARGEYEPVSLRVEAAPPRPALAAADSGPGADPGALSRFGALVEGTWEGSDSRHVYEWAVGRNALRSRSYTPQDDGWRLVSEGFWYQGEEGEVRGVVVAVDMPFHRMEYESRVDGDRVVHELRTFGPAEENWVETWHFMDDSYTWPLERRTATGLERFMAGEYQRATP